ncbi:hypothetical protein D3C73_211100 [compost metagenome]
MNGTGNQAVNFAFLQHQGAENHVVFQLLTRNHFGHALALTQLNQTRHIEFTHGNRIDDLDAFTQLNALRGGNAFDLFRVTQQHTFRDTTFGTDGRRFHGTWFVAFRQHDTFTRFACQLGQLITERRWGQTT